jgi:hypothetical protein
VELTSGEGRWRRLGLVYHQGLAREWMVSHGANPTAGEVDGRVVRVYFNARDGAGRAHVCWADIDFGDPLHPVCTRVCDQPVFSPGERGLFDDSGVSLGCFAQADDGSTYLYYMGWNLGQTVPWRNSIGLAVRRAGAGTFERLSPAPVMDRSREDPYTLSYPWVLRESGIWRMWYGSHTRWRPAAAGGQEPEFEHVIKYAESDDGIAWRRRAEPVLGPGYPNEYAPSRPCVLRLDGLLHMWYCSRGESYRIYHAVSHTGLEWQTSPAGPVLDVAPNPLRRPLFDLGTPAVQPPPRLELRPPVRPRPVIGTAPPVWDSEMTCYPCVFELAGRRYMLYNGNAYGRDGFGVAVAETGTLN